MVHWVVVRPIRLFPIIDYENLSWFPTLLDRVTTTAWNYSVIIVVLWCLLKVIVIQLQVGLWIDAGSRFETEKNNGVAHFLEHMAFKVLLSVWYIIKLKKSSFVQAVGGMNPCFGKQWCVIDQAWCQVMNIGQVPFLRFYGPRWN